MIQHCYKIRIHDSNKLLAISIAVQKICDLKKNANLRMFDRKKNFFFLIQLNLFRIKLLFAPSSFIFYFMKNPF